MDRMYEQDIYELIERGEEVNCIYEDCKGYLKVANKFIHNYSKWSYGKSLLCICSINCKHKLAVLKDNFCKKSIILKL
jgi:hypothetical protein